ncbi:hypothetical protein ACKKBF_B31825 [Auxenochlorella protothecoides x Auxenochlorella symbiontica]
MYGSAGVHSNPSGMLLSGGSFGRKSQALWASAGQLVSMGQAGLGLVIMLLSWLFFYEFTEATGLMLGAAMLGAGGVGWAGGRARSANLSNLHLLATLLALLLSFNFIGQVVREVHVDCGLAELFLQGRVLEERVTALRQTEAMHTVYSRLNEMEDMLTLVQEGAAKTLELKGEQERLRHTDAAYIGAKLDLLRRHAQSALDNILSNPNLNETVVRNLNEADKDYLRKRLDTADRVVARIQKHHEEDGQDITFEEYNELLSALTDASVFADKHGDGDLVQARAELPNMAGALKRRRDDEYHNLLPGSAHKDLERINARRARSRAEWERQLTQILDAQARAGAGGADMGTQLAEHCVRESRGHAITMAAGLLAVAVQLASAYVALSLSMRLPLKGD